jgi:hypothetical protein
MKAKIIKIKSGVAAMRRQQGKKYSLESAVVNFPGYQSERKREGRHDMREYR